MLQHCNYLILIVTVLLFPLPSTALAVIFTDFFFPALYVVTVPLEETFAYFVLLLDHFNVLFAPADALVFPFRYNFLPAFTDLTPEM